MQIKSNSAFDYEIGLADGAENQYPQTKLYEEDGTLVTTLNLAHVADGNYNASYTYTGSDERLKARTIVYSDAGHTTENTSYDRFNENIDVIDYQVDAIWDEPLTGATHNVPTSSGRRLRQLAGAVVIDGTAVSSTSNTIVLDADASSVGGAYDPSVIFISEGTGSGQCRLIIEYNGTTKSAAIDRNWKVNPDATSKYVIMGDAGREHVNEGLAQAGTSTTITLNTLASSSDDAYIAQVVFIRSGTGEDQARRITDYNGTTKVATIQSAWDVNPDATSGYVILPTGMIKDSCIASAVWDAALSDYEVADTYGEQVALTGADGDTLETLSDQIDGISTGDATEANQTIIIDHLTDVKGTGFAKDTDSLTDLAHTGDDDDTLETLSDQLDGIESQLESSTAVTDELNGTTISKYRNTTWTINRANLGNISSYDEIIFAVKDSQTCDDSGSIVLVSSLNGLEYINKAAATDSTKASIAINDAVTGDITITVNETVTGLSKMKDGYYGIKGIVSGGVSAISEGEFNILQITPRAVS